MKKILFILSVIFTTVTVNPGAFALDGERINARQQTSLTSEPVDAPGQPAQDLSLSTSGDNLSNTGPGVPLTVTPGGRMTLVSGQSITLKPGTRIEAGGYLKASIADKGMKQVNRHGYSGRTKKKGNPLKDENGPVIIQAVSSISPFFSKTSSSIAQNDPDEENLVAQVVRGSGISPEPTRKITDDLVQNISYRTEKVSRLITNNRNHLSTTRETIQVLRL